MILDNPDLHKKFDQADILSTIKSLPDYIEKGWVLGQSIKGFASNRFKSITIFGEGILADAEELVISFLKQEIDIPVFLIQDGQLPVWLMGKENLTIILNSPESSEPGLSLLQQTYDYNCTCLAVDFSGAFTKIAKKLGILVYSLEKNDCTYGLIFSFLLSIFYNFGFIDNIRSEIDVSLNEIRNLISKIDNDVLTSRNPAKRMAIQMLNRWILIIGGGYMYPVARHWMNQINLFAKCWAQTANLPRMRNNLLEGSIFPDNMVSHTMLLFLNSSFNDQKLQTMTESVKQSLMVTGLGTDMVNARGENLLSQIFTSIIFGDFVAYYLSLAYQVDPSLRINIDNP